MTPELVSAIEASVEDAERRLHPMSWLFVLFAQLKQFLIPLLALLVFGRGDSGELWSLIGVGALVGVAVWRYFTYRYGVTGDALVVRSGLVERSLRVIPFARIHNVALQQTVMHRVFGVAEVRLESAGGRKPEAEMRVLKLDEALALETLVRQHRTSTASGARGVPVAVREATPLLRLSTADMLRLGLVSNRGLIVVGAASAGLSQFSPRLIPNLFEQAAPALFGWAGDRQFGAPEYALAALSLLALAVVVLRLFSVLLALLQYYDFTLSEHGRRLTVERGLLARWRTSASRRRIQAWTLREGVLHRWLGRRSLEVDTAVAEQENERRALRELAPIATPDACNALIQHLLPQARWSQLEWRRLPYATWWRLFLPGAAIAVLLSFGLSWRFDAWALLLLLLLPWSLYRARQYAVRSAYASNDDVVAVREGWWSRTWRFAELDKLQALQLTRNPLDRRCGTATLWLDTAGAGRLTPPLRIRFLPEADARTLHDRLAHALARRPLRW